ncbi:hypothetical protein L484_005372 [Morus notabilis]|uniref:Uncharacterized protein n=1 Tax=Morus notabilis TaxID=981085 RepID=W9RV53_9ROSA|nr:hypothetical protein L484_005372 [Morus notabilis]
MVTYSDRGEQAIRQGDSEIAEAWFDQAAEYWKQALALTPDVFGFKISSHQPRKAFVKAAESISFACQESLGPDKREAYKNSELRFQMQCGLLVLINLLE